MVVFILEDGQRLWMNKCESGTTWLWTSNSFEFVRWSAWPVTKSCQSRFHMKTINLVVKTGCSYSVHLLVCKLPLTQSLFCGNFYTDAVWAEHGFMLSKPRGRKITCTETIPYFSETADAVSGLHFLETPHFCQLSRHDAVYNKTLQRCTANESRDLI